MRVIRERRGLAGNMREIEQKREWTAKSKKEGKNDKTYFTYSALRLN
jgi:hypothetical protein